MLDVRAACLFPPITYQLVAPSAADGGLGASGDLSEASSSGNASVRHHPGGLFTLLLMEYFPILHPAVKGHTGKLLCTVLL